MKTTQQIAEELKKAFEDDFVDLTGEAVISVPDEWSPQQLLHFQSWWNATIPTIRGKVKFIPGGMRPVEPEPVRVETYAERYAEANDGELVEHKLRKLGPGHVDTIVEYLETTGVGEPGLEFQIEHTAICTWCGASTGFADIDVMNGYFCSEPCRMRFRWLMGKSLTPRIDDSEINHTYRNRKMTKYKDADELDAALALDKMGNYSVLLLRLQPSRIVKLYRQGIRDSLPVILAADEPISKESVAVARTHSMHCIGRNKCGECDVASLRLGAELCQRFSPPMGDDTLCLRCGRCETCHAKLPV